MPVEGFRDHVATDGSLSKECFMQMGSTCLVSGAGANA